MIGPGGVGKTHLSLQAAADQLDRYEDGVWLVRLGEVSDPAMIVSAIAATIGARESGGLSVRGALLHWIGDRHLLFVLDNVEQVISGAPAIADLLAASPNARVLATSRQRLGIGGECVLDVQPLPLIVNQADADTEASIIPERSPAVQLFLERAQEVAPGFVFDERAMAAVVAICAQLDGLPLAIELAAAQLRTRTLHELLADLERRFDLLVGGRREALSHQHSLAATIAWSYERLEPREQRLMRLLSAFAGGWSRDAAEAIAGDLNDVGRRLDALVGQSLIRRGTTDGEVSRWSMLESIRAFGRARLHDAGEEAVAFARHAGGCLAFAAEAAGHLDDAEQEEWLARLDLEHDNARAALHWLSDAGEVGRGLSLATALAPFWQIRGHLTEGRRWLESLLGGAVPDLLPRLGAMVEAGILAQTQGDYEGASQWFTQALAEARRQGDRGREAVLLNNLGAAAMEQGNFDDAERQFGESLALAEAIGDQHRQANALSNLAATAQYRDESDLALRLCLEGLTIWRELGDARSIAETLLGILFLLSAQPEHRHRACAAGEESLRRFRALGDPRGEALALTGLGLVEAGQGDLDRAAALHEESLLLARRSEDRATEARALGNLGLVELDRGHLDRAFDLLARNLTIIHELGDPDGRALSLEALAALHAAQGQNKRAARLCGVTSALRRQMTLPRPPESRQRHATVTEVLMQRLGDRYGSLFQEGETMPLDQAISAALALDPAPASNDPLAMSLQALDHLLGVPTLGNAQEPASRKEAAC